LIASTVTGGKHVPQCEKFRVQARNILTNLSPNLKAQSDLQLCAAVTTLKIVGDAIVTFKCLWRNYVNVVA